MPRCHIYIHALSNSNYCGLYYCVKTAMYYRSAKEFTCMVGGGKTCSSYFRTNGVW